MDRRIVGWDRLIMVIAVVLMLVCFAIVEYDEYASRIYATPSPVAYAMLGVTYVDRQSVHERASGVYDPEKAIQCLKIALKMNPNDVHSANNLGIAYERVGNYNNSEYAFLWAMAVSVGSYHDVAKSNLELLYAKHPIFFDRGNSREVIFDPEHKSPLYGGFVVMEQEYKPGMWRTE